MLSILPGVDYVARGTVADAGSIGKLRAMLKRAFEVQLGGGRFALVEVLANCPVGWGMTAPESIAHLADVAKTYPVGLLLDRAKGIVPASPVPYERPGRQAPAPAPTEAGAVTRGTGTPEPGVRW
jgi:hypothetical protein